MWLPAVTKSPSQMTIQCMLQAWAKNMEEVLVIDFLSASGEDSIDA